MPLLPPRPASQPVLAYLAQHPEVLDCLIAHHNAHSRLEVVVVQNSVTTRAAVQSAASGAVVKLELPAS